MGKRSGELGFVNEVSSVNKVNCLKPTSQSPVNCLKRHSQLPVNCLKRHSQLPVKVSEEKLSDILGVISCLLVNGLTPVTSNLFERLLLIKCPKLS